MKTHFCKVGKVSAFQNQPTNLKNLETRYDRFVEEAYNLKQTDTSKSDILYHEASKLKKRIFHLKSSQSKDLDVAF